MIELSDSWSRSVCEAVADVCFSLHPDGYSVVVGQRLNRTVCKEQRLVKLHAPNRLVETTNKLVDMCLTKTFV